jgi:hypothetical protein
MRSERQRLFSLIGGRARAGELVRLEIDFGNHLVFAWGDVVYAVEEWASRCAIHI